MTGLWIFLGVLGAIAIFNPVTLRRLKTAFVAQTNKLGMAAENADPMAVLKLRVDNGIENIAKARKGLADSKALVLSVERQVKSGQEDKARLENRIKSVLDSGDPNNTATGYAEQLANVEEHLAQNTEQLAKHKEMYENFVKQVELGQKRVEEAREEARVLGLQLQQSEREAELSKFAQSFDPNSLNLDDVAEAKAKVLDKIDRNKASGDVALDLSRQKVAEAADDELDRKAKADAILQRFRKA